MPKLGEAIRLNLQLFDGATNMFPRAYLYDADGDELGDSPVDLAHVGNGLYSDDSVAMPETAQVRAAYRVFTDAGHTTVSEDHSDALDVYDLIEDSAFLGATAPDLVGILDDAGVELIGLIDDSGDVVGKVEDC